MIEKLFNDCNPSFRVSQRTKHKDAVLNLLVFLCSPGYKTNQEAQDEENRRSRACSRQQNWRETEAAMQLFFKALEK